MARPLGWYWSGLHFPVLNGDGRPHVTPLGDALPDSLADVFADESLQEAVMAIRKHRIALERSRGSWNPFLPPRLADLLDEAEALITGSIPNAICKACEGAGCPLCMSQGWVPGGVG